DRRALPVHDEPVLHIVAPHRRALLLQHVPRHLLPGDRDLRAGAPPRDRPRARHRRPAPGAPAAARALAGWASARSLAALASSRRTRETGDRGRGIGMGMVGT